MFHFLAGLFSLVGLVVTVAGTIFAFGLAREYVRNRLRFVDAVRHPLAPWITWIAATVILLPIVWILPLIGPTTAVLIGAGAGLGTSSGIKALKRGD